VSGVRLRIVVRGVSPLIVRVVDVPAGTSLASLHGVLLECFGWSGECLHVFEIRACSYSGSGYVEAESWRGVTLGSLGLRIGERFRWRYDFCSGWVIDIRVESLTDGDELRVVSGRRAGPPEWVGGPEAFMAWEDSHSFSEAIDIVADALDCGLDDASIETLRDRLLPMREWLVRDMYDRVKLQRQVLDACRHWHELEVSQCELSSKSASTTTRTLSTVS